MTDSVLMIKPKNFGFNTQTAKNNSFQNKDIGLSAKQISSKALKEFNSVVSELKRHDIEVHVIDDTSSPIKTDAIFPNNWFSTHQGKYIVTYPLWSKSRRKERRKDIIERLINEFGFSKRYAFEYLEDEDQFLEGTGSMVLDRENKIAYASLSSRTDIRVLEKFAVVMEYRKIIFHATDSGVPIYHTNVLMSVCDNYAIICLETIEDEIERKNLSDSILRSGKEIINITKKQMHLFAANCLQLKSKLGQSYLVLSQSAYDSLSAKQLDQIKSHNNIIRVSIPTIQSIGGGGVRCMIVELFF